MRPRQDVLLLVLAPVHLLGPARARCSKYVHVREEEDEHVLIVYHNDHEAENGHHDAPVPSYEN